MPSNRRRAPTPSDAFETRASQAARTTEQHSAPAGGTPVPGPLVGAILKGRYRIDSLLGQGGMGAVYRAHDQVLDRDVAVKALAQGALDGVARARLLSEARAAAALNHPHIVSVYDTGEDGGTPFVVMELVPGGSLREAGKLSLAQVVALARQLCEALAHAHAHGIIHRDVKPENVLLAEAGDRPQAKLADLGIALSQRSARHTAEGAVLGTAHYLAPEHALGQKIDGRADLYALGVVLYELTTGRLPFTGDGPLAVISQHLHATAPSGWRGRRGTGRLCSAGGNGRSPW